MSQLLVCRPSIEVPLAALPEIRTADRVPIAAIVFIERGRGVPAAYPLTGAESVERLLCDMPGYSDAVNAMHERTVRKLAGAAAYRMRYEALEDAIRILETLIV